MSEGTLPDKELPAAAAQQPSQVGDEKVTKPPELRVKVDKDPAARFRGVGTSFKGKLIGIEEVPESRGDEMCQHAILKLKAGVKASGQHKHKVFINVSLEGLKIIDPTNATILHQHAVPKISFIARDLTDRRAFGYVYGDDDGKHKFYGIKTTKLAQHLVFALRDLFQVAYDLKITEMNNAKKQAETGSTHAEGAAAQPNNNTSTHSAQQPSKNLFEMEAQLQNINQMSAIDAFNQPWPENTPTSPDTPGSPVNDMLGTMNPSDKSSLSSEFSMASTSSVAPDTKARFVDTRTTQAQHVRANSSKSVTSRRGPAGHRLPSLFNKASRKKQAAPMPPSEIQEINEQSNGNVTSANIKQTEILTETDSTQKDGSKHETNKQVIATQFSDDALEHPLSEAQQGATVTVPSDSVTNGTSVENMLTSQSNEIDASQLSDVSPGATETSVAVTSSNDKSAPELSDSVNASDSMVSTSANPVPTPKKSLSLSSLLFSKPDKRKPVPQKRNKLSVKSSSTSAVISTNDAAITTTTTTLSDYKCSVSEKKTKPLSLGPSLDETQINKKSDISTNLAVTAVPLKLPEVSPAMPSVEQRKEKNEIKVSQERTLPPAGVARPRPRGSLSKRTTMLVKSDSQNPPMFKRKHFASDSGEESYQSPQSPFDLSGNSQVNSPKRFELSEGNEKTLDISTELPNSEEKQLPATEDWASFDNQKTKNDQDTNKHCVWNVSSPADDDASTIITQDNAWASFSNNDSVATASATSILSPSLDVRVKSVDKDSSGEKDDPKKDMFNSTLLDEPQADAFLDSPFENYDPFGNDIPEDPLQDPFQNIEDFFVTVETLQENVEDDAKVTEHSSSELEGEDIFRWTGDASKNVAMPASDSSGSISDEMVVPDVHDSFVHKDANSDQPKSQSTSLSPSKFTSLLSVHGNDVITVPCNNLNLPPEQSDLSPPPVPPRNIITDSLPPTILPPPLPNRVKLENETIASSDEEQSDSNSSDHPYAAPDCVPPELPTVAVSLPETIDFTYLSNVPPAVPSRNLSQHSSTSEPAIQKCNDTNTREPPPAVPNRRWSHKSSGSFTSNNSVNFHEAQEDEKNNSNRTKHEIYSTDLTSISLAPTETVSSPPVHLTKEQILAGFGQATPVAYVYQQQPQQQWQGPGSFPPQQPMYGMPQQLVYTVAAPALANGFTTLSSSPQQQVALSMFPPSPVIPARPGTVVSLATVQAGAPVFPVNSQPGVVYSSSPKTERIGNDPFASLSIPNRTSPSNPNPMFDNSQVAKPRQQVTSSNGSVSADFENYMRKSVGGVVVDDKSKSVFESAPIPAPRSISRQVLSSSPSGSTGSNDPYSIFDSLSSPINQPFNFNNQNHNNNTQLLYG